MKVTIESPLREVIKMDGKIALTLHESGIDICKNVNQSFKEVLGSNQLVPKIRNRLMEQLECKQEPMSPYIDGYEHWTLSSIIDNIVENHHTYVEQRLPVIKEYLSKVVSVYKDERPELVEIDAIFKKSSGELAMHMKREELILFPFIKKMENASRDNITIGVSRFGGVKEIIARMDDEHDEEEREMERVKELSNNFALPEDACGSYTIVYSLLEEFYEDLRTHVYKETKILFKRAMALEEELKHLKLIQ